MVEIQDGRNKCKKKKGLNMTEKEIKNAVIDIKEEQNRRSEKKFVYKIKGKGNKYFSAFFVKSINITKTSEKGQKVDVSDVLIAFRNNQGLENVHGTLTCILNEIWGNNIANAKYTRANHLVKFLNWTLINKRYYKYYHNLSDLTLEMFVEYLNKIYYDYDHETHKYAKKTLMLFYKVMRKYVVIKEYLDEETIDTKFDSLRISKFERKQRRHNLPRELIKILIEICESVAEEILLGVMFGILGGCRVGELVNLTNTAVRPVGIYDYKLSIKDRMLRPDVQSTRTRGTPKVPRSQKVYNSYIGIELFGEMKLKEIYDNHKINYKAIDGSNALFVDTNGQAMTANVFKAKFKKVKKAFIKYIKDSKNPVVNAYAAKLQSDRWGVHILRGIFSWLYAEKVGSTSKGIKQLQSARGDKSPESAMRYLSDIDEVNRMREKAIHEVRETNFKKKPLPVEIYRLNKD